MSETPRFRQYDDVVVIECDEAGKLCEGGTYLYGCVTEAGPCSVRIQLGDGTVWLFLLDSRGRAWRESGRLQLFPACPRCEFPILGTPVVAEDDPLRRQFCRVECLDDAAQSAFEQRYRPGVAT